MPGKESDKRPSVQMHVRPSGPRIMGVAPAQQISDHFHAMLDNLPAWISVRDSNGRYLMINDYAYEHVGHLTPADSRDATIGTVMEEMFPAGLSEAFVAADTEVKKTREPFYYELEIPDKSGDMRTYEFCTYPVFGQDGEISGFGRYGLDVTDVKRAQRERERAETLFRTAFDHAPTGIGLTRVENGGVGRFERVNPALCAMFGYSAEELMQLGPLALTHPQDRPGTRESARALLAGEVDTIHRDRRYIRADDEVVWTSLHTTVLRDDDGRPGHFMTQWVDITERIQLEQRLRYQADRDPLTGLLNRRAFETLLDKHLGEVQMTDGRGALLSIDIDHLKRVNDTFGHGAGDEVIKTVARVLEAHVRSSDAVTRLAGDEFAVLLRAADADGARQVGEQVVHAIAQAELEFNGGLAFRPSASVGVTLLGPELVSGKEALVNADVAMYQAKRSGRGRAAVS
ncbi:MAG: diguanylate cyclase [Solirubrobacterales bacterium]|nr:diguanylate cyclase [Solirubrobacterales bacterium]